MFHNILIYIFESKSIILFQMIFGFQRVRDESHFFMKKLDFWDRTILSPTTVLNSEHFSEFDKNDSAMIG